MIGTVLGNYRIIEKIGDGGMGSVYLAEQAEIGARSAIKVLHPHYFHDAEIRTRFLTEARAISLLSHPGIVQIYDYGSDDRGHAFIVMEYLQGEDLSKRLRRVGELPVSLSLNFVKQVAKALGAAHQAGIVHRDLKPDNLFLVRAVGVEKVERVKILDFGVAKLVSQEHGSLSKTQTGTVIGTPPYMSPEQCKGNAAVDHRADLYSLGCIMFRMMCGRTPFLSNGYGEMLAAHIHTPPPRPRDIAPEIPPVFEAVILKLLEKEPHNRFQNAQELVAAVDDGIASIRLPEPGVSRAHPATGASPQAGSGWVMQVHQTGAQSHLAPHGTPSPAPRPAPRPTPMPTPMPMAMAMPTPSATAIPSYPRADVTPGSQPRGPAPWPQRVGPGGHQGMGAAAVNFPGTPPPVAPKRRRVGLIALGTAVCVASALATLIALQVGPFAAGENLAVAETSPATDTKIAVRPPVTKDTTPPGQETGVRNGNDVQAGDPEAGNDQAPDKVAGETGEDETGNSGIEATDEKDENPGEVTLGFESDPAGAEIYRKADGVRIGVTPHEITVPAIDGELVVLIKKNGYRSREVAIRSDLSSTTNVELERKTSAGKPKRRPPRKKKPTPKPKPKPKPKPGNDESPNPFK